MEVLALIFAWLKPPREASGPRVNRWRTSVVAMLMANMIVTGTAVALGLGLVPAVFAGFAPKSVIADVSDRVAEVRRYQLDTALIDTRTKQCVLMNNRRGDASDKVQLNFATARLQGQLEAWMRLIKSPYRLPGCDEL